MDWILCFCVDFGFRGAVLVVICGFVDLGTTLVCATCGVVGLFGPCLDLILLAVG